jgi:hypothetical protein
MKTPPPYLSKLESIVWGLPDGDPNGDVFTYRNSKGQRLIFCDDHLDVEVDGALESIAYRDIVNLETETSEGDVRYGDTIVLTGDGFCKRFSVDTVSLGKYADILQIVKALRRKMILSKSV